MFEKTCCDKNMVEPFTCGQLRLDVQRLTAQLAERDAKIEQFKIMYKGFENQAVAIMNHKNEIDKLNGNIAERDAEIERLNRLKFIETQTGVINGEWCSKMVEENTTLRAKLAECEKEAERLAKEMLIQRANAELFHNSKRIEARKQAAREMLEWLLSNRPLRYTERLNFDRMVAKFKIKFGLEG